MICTRCGKEKDASLFYRNRWEKTGRHHWCKVCCEEARAANGYLSQHTYAASHAEERAAYRRAYYVDHKDETLARCRIWREANRDRVLANVAAYRRTHRDSVNHHKRMRRTRMAGLDATMTPQQWERMVDSFSGECAYCGAECESPEADHLVSVKMGGGYAWGNIFPACRVCNARKSSMSPVEFLGIRKYADLVVSCH